MASIQHPSRRDDSDGDGQFPPQTPDAEVREGDSDDEALDAVEESSPKRLPTKAMREIMALVGQWGPAPHPLADKITGEHISKMLDIDGERVRNQREGERDERRTHLILSMVFCLFVLALMGMLLWRGNDELTKDLLTSLAALAAGLLGGYGLGRSRKD